MILGTIVLLFHLWEKDIEIGKENRYILWSLCNIAPIEVVWQVVYVVFVV